MYFSACGEQFSTLTFTHGACEGIRNSIKNFLLFVDARKAFLNFCFNKNVHCVLLGAPSS